MARPNFAGPRVCLVALCLLQLAPIWAFRIFPTQDGGSHLENARALLLLGRPELPVFGEFFAVNRRPAPNWLGHAALAGLSVVAGPLAAEKLLLSMYVLGLPLAVWYAMGAWRADAAPLAILSVPFLYNCLLHYGFFNFCLSMALFFAVLGWWLRRAARGRWSDAAGLAVWLVLLYACHIISWGLALVALLLFAPRAVARVAAAGLPSIALAVWFFLGRTGAAAVPPAVGFAARWSGLWNFSPSVFSYAAPYQWAGAAFAFFLTVVAGACVARGIRGAPLGFSAGLLGAYFLAPPESSGGMALLERLNLYFFLSLLLWVARIEWSRRWRIFFSAGSAALTLLLLLLNWPWYRAADRQIADFLAGAAVIPPNAVILPLIYDARGPAPLADLYGEPMRHTAGYVAVLRDALNLDNYEAQTDLFPVVFREAHNPGVLVGAMEADPPHVRLDWPRIDYLMVWDPARRAPQPPKRFVAVFTSPLGYLRVWRARRPSAD